MAAALAIGGPTADGMNAEDVRQFRGEVQRWTREAEQLRRMLQGEKIDPKEIDAMLRNLRQLNDDRVYKDVEELARLQAQVTDSAKRLEYDLRRKVEGTDAPAAALGLRRSAREVPQERRAVLPVAVEGAGRCQGAGRRQAAGRRSSSGHPRMDSCQCAASSPPASSP